MVKVKVDCDQSHDMLTAVGLLRIKMYRGQNQTENMFVFSIETTDASGREVNGDLVAPVSYKELELLGDWITNTLEDFTRRQRKDDIRKACDNGTLSRYIDENFLGK